MKCKLAFGLASDDLFFVTTNLHPPEGADQRSNSKLTTFRDENEFLELLIAANLCEKYTVRLVLATLLSVAKPTAPPEWIEVDLTQNQIDRLQLNGFANRTSNSDFREAYNHQTGPDLQTQKVLAGAVRENRETLLYRQWAELDSIYDNAPIGLILIDAKDFRILRLNERQAALMGGNALDFLGKPVWDVVYDIPGLPEMFNRIIAGQTIENQILEGELTTSPGVHRYWLVNFAPTFSEDGKVEAITAVSLEISSQTKADILLCPKQHPYTYKMGEIPALAV